MTELVKRTYRITKTQDKEVKKHKKKAGGESAFIRQAIDEKTTKQ